MVEWNNIRWSLQLSGRTMSFQALYDEHWSSIWNEHSWRPMYKWEVAWHQILTWIMQQNSFFSPKNRGERRGGLKPQSMWGSWGSLLHIELTMPSVVNGCTKFPYLQVDTMQPSISIFGNLWPTQVATCFFWLCCVMTWFQKLCVSLLSIVCRLWQISFKFGLDLSMLCLPIIIPDGFDIYVQFRVLLEHAEGTQPNRRQKTTVLQLRTG